MYFLSIVACIHVYTFYYTMGDHIRGLLLRLPLVAVSIRERVSTAFLEQRTHTYVEGK